MNCEWMDNMHKIRSEVEKMMLEFIEKSAHYKEANDINSEMAYLSAYGKSKMLLNRIDEMIRR